MNHIKRYSKLFESNDIDELDFLDVIKWIRVFSDYSIPIIFHGKNIPDGNWEYLIDPGGLFRSETNAEIEKISDSDKKEIRNNLKSVLDKNNIDISQLPDISDIEDMLMPIKYLKENIVDIVYRFNVRPFMVDIKINLLFGDDIDIDTFGELSEEIVVLYHRLKDKYKDIIITSTYKGSILISIIG